MPSLYRVKLNSDQNAAQRVFSEAYLYADDAEDAAVLANALSGADVDGLFTEADNVSDAVPAANDWEGVRFTVTISGGAAQDPDPITVVVTGDSTNDTLDEIGTAIAAALADEDGPNLDASYTAGTNTLVLAADDPDAIGDATVTITVEVPNPFEPDTFIPATGAVSANITDGGDAAADLTAVFTEGTVPVLYAAFNQDV